MPSIFLRISSLFGRHSKRKVNDRTSNPNGVPLGSNSSQTSVDGWTLLIENSAPDALYNDRLEECSPGTRVEAIREIMEWIENHDAPSRMLCMTAPAGAGKSTLQYTIARTCMDNGILASSFFPSIANPTRYTVATIIPTIAYQLGQKNPALKQFIKCVVEKDVSVFSQSLQAQFTALIVTPFKCFQKNQGRDGARSFPYAILIDGLDECGEEDRQAELLLAIRQTLLVEELPFRIFITSRPEKSISTAIGHGGSLDGVAYQLQLDGHDVTHDLRLYLQEKLLELFGACTPQWFTEHDAEILIQSASGQFVFLATVFNYISEGQGPSADKLKTVLTWTRQHQRDSEYAQPFDALDNLYTHILLEAKDAYEGISSHAGRDFLLLVRLYQANNIFDLAIRLPVDILTAMLNLECHGLENLLSNIPSLVAVERDHERELRLRIHHKSFSDFWTEKSRAKDLFVPLSRVDAHIAKCCLRHILQCPVIFDNLPDNWEGLQHCERRKGSYQAAVWYLPWFLGCATSIDDDLVHFTQQSGWEKVDRLLPLAYRNSPNFFPCTWAVCLGKFLDSLKDRIPEVTAVLGKFHSKWAHDLFEWRTEPCKLLAAAKFARLVPVQKVPG